MVISKTSLAALVLLWGTPALAQATIPASGADWIVEGDQPTGTFAQHVSGAGDIDGDGYDDVLVGDASYDGAFAGSGRIGFYRGSVDGLSTEPDWILEGSTAGAGLSRAWPAGDLNDDGFDDVVVLSSADLLLYLGSPAGPAPAPWALSGTPLGHGDVNADGFDDLAVYSGLEISIFHGSAAGLDPSPSTVLPLPLAERAAFLDGVIAEDFNGDGHDDLAYTWQRCARDCRYLIAELRVHIGSPDGLVANPKRTFDFRGKDENLVPFVATAGDANGDGFGDLALTVRPDLASPQGPDEVLLLRGSPSGLRTRSSLVAQVPAGSLWPWSVDGAGDLNGDGFDDLFVPGLDYNAPHPRTLMVFAGSPGGYSQLPALTIEPETAGFEPVMQASRAGDVNGDGLGDLLFGSPEFRSGGSPVGRACVVHGRPGLLVLPARGVPAPPRGAPAPRGSGGA